MSLRLVLIAGVAAAQFVAAPAFAQQGFGSFPTEPSGTWVPMPGGRPHFELGADFLYLDPDNLAWLAPEGTRVDGASIPWFLWSVIGGPFSGDYLHASIIHDHFCDTRERTSDATHLAFYYGMRAKGVGLVKANAMYWAVVAFGPSWRREERVVLTEICSETDGRVTCQVTPVVRSEAVLNEGLDFGDPEVLAIAEAKFAAIVRTLQTSDGEVLDIGPSGNVGTSLDSIRQNALNFSGIVETKAYVDRPDLLGIMSATGLEEFDQVIEWPRGELPRFDQLPDFDAATELEPFTLAPGELLQLQQQLLLDQRTFEFELPADLR